MAFEIEKQYVVNGKIFKKEEDAKHYISELEFEKNRRETLQKEKQNRVKEIRQAEEKLRNMYINYSKDYGHSYQLTDFMEALINGRS